MEAVTEKMTESTVQKKVYHNMSSFFDQTIISQLPALQSNKNTSFAKRMLTWIKGNG